MQPYLAAAAFAAFVAFAFIVRRFARRAAAAVAPALPSGRFHLPPPPPFEFDQLGASFFPPALNVFGACERDFADYLEEAGADARVAAAEQSLADAQRLLADADRSIADLERLIEEQEYPLDLSEQMRAEHDADPAGLNAGVRPGLSYRGRVYPPGTWRPRAAGPAREAAD